MDFVGEHLLPGKLGPFFILLSLVSSIVSNHLFEYKFVWQHSSLSLEAEYLLSCIWEAQEGSFLLWSIWHSVLGLVIIRREKQWEAPVMTVLSFVQFCLATMLVGFTLFGIKVGS